MNMFEKKPVGVDVAADADSSGVRLMAHAGPLAAGIVGRKLRIKVCICAGSPVSMREYPLPPGRVTGISVYPQLSLAMANGDLMMWNDLKWVKCFNLADEEHDS